MIERATVLRCENVNNQTFILHPGLSINREIRVFPRAVGNTGKYREIGNPCPHNLLNIVTFTWLGIICSSDNVLTFFWIEGGMIRSCQHWTWAPLAAGVNYIYQANYVIGFAVWGQEIWTKQSWIKDLHYDCGWVTWWKAVIKNFLQLLLSLVWYNKKNLGSKSYLVINTRVVWIREN